MIGHLHSHDIVALEHRVRIDRHNRLARRAAPQTTVDTKSPTSATRESRSRLHRRR